MPPDTPVGDRFCELLETCRHFLLAIANQEMPLGLLPKGGASDVVQEAMTAAYQARFQFRGRTFDDLRAWLRVILRNELAAFRRRYVSTASRDISRETPLESTECVCAATPDSELIRREEDRRLAEAVTHLPDTYRSAVVLRLERGMTFAEIGTRLGRTEEAARKLFTRGLDQLRLAIGELA